MNKDRARAGVTYGLVAIVSGLLGVFVIDRLQWLEIGLALFIVAAICLIVTFFWFAVGDPG